jgi:phosphoribosylglycinamide formyltransferase
LKANPGKTRDDYDAEVARMVLNVQPDLVVLAGWMHVFGDGFLNLVSQPSSSVEQELSSSFPADFKFPIPVINLHPALPGAFDGAHAIDRAWEAYKEGKLDKKGVMVHRVVRQVDAGEPVLVQEVPFEDGESKEQFEQRLQAVEWKVIVAATNIVLTQRLEQIQS